MLARIDLLPTIDIRVETDYNDITRQFIAYLEFESLEELNGEFKYNVILVEDSIVWDQAGSSGGPNYVHDWTVREMINGSAGELIYNGVWDPHQIFSDSIFHTVFIPTSPAPDIRPEFCKIVVFVYKVGTPINSNAEIQQAIQIPLTIPEYKVEISSTIEDVFQSSSMSYNYDVLISNTGKFDDTYNLKFDFIGPSSWVISFITPNGIFNQNQNDTLMLNSGEQQLVQVFVDPNEEEGFGRPKIFLNSLNQNSTKDSIDLRFVTLNVENLIVDDDKDKNYENYSKAIFDSLGIDYGILKSSILNTNSFLDFTDIKFIQWQTGITKPGLNQLEMDFIAQYLDHGGNIYLSGNDLAYQLADSTSAFYSQNSLDFFKNYLHADYINRDPIYTVGQGVTGDTISQNIIRMWLNGGTGANIIRGNSGKYANQINIGDSLAVPMFSFYFIPNDLIGIHALHPGQSSIGNIFFTTFGFETIAELANRYEILNNMTRYLNIVSEVEINHTNPVISKLTLNNNYPNPFNAKTTISFSLPKTQSQFSTKIILYDVLGKKVKTILNNILIGGDHQVIWNGTNEFNKQVSSGIYYYKVISGQQEQTKKMLLLR